MDDSEYLGLIPVDHWPGLLAAAAVAVVLGLLAYFIGRAVLTRIAARNLFVSQLLPRIAAPCRWVLVLFALDLVWHLAPDKLHAIVQVRRIDTVALIAAITWLIVGWIMAVGDTVIRLHPVTGPGNLEARRIVTQTRVLTRSVAVVIALIGVGFALMSLPGVRQLGASLLASAGVAGIAAGIAAKPVLGNLIAGLQIAFTQPIRIDDVLIVENEWGRVEEITATYVVLKLWDERRLVVPLQWFIENPFQNWTRTSAQLLCPFFMWVDYRLPVDALRGELEKRCKEMTEWDGRVCIVQVTDFSERTVQLRVLVSAADASLGFDLRCKLREVLIDYIRREHPYGLPLTRLEMPPPSQADKQAAADPGSTAAVAAAAGDAPGAPKV